MCLRTRDFTKTLSLKSVHILNRQRHFTSSHATTGVKKRFIKGEEFRLLRKIFKKFI